MSFFLTSTDTLQISTSAALILDVHASYIDLNTSTETATPSRTNTAITTATTTTIVSSPDSGKIRKIKSIRIRNKCSLTDGYLTDVDGYVLLEQVTSGGNTIQLFNDNLGPGKSLFINENLDVSYLSSGGEITPSYYGVIVGAFGCGNPNTLLSMCQNNGVVSATPTNIGTSIARCCFFRLPFDLTVNKIRYYGVGDTTDIYHVAIYRYSDLARLTADYTFSTAANTWGIIGNNIGLSLATGILYFMACSVDTTGTTAGVLCMGATVTATTGQIQSAPQSLPVSLDADNGYLYSYNFQFAVTTGALPDPAAELVAQAAWTGGMPAFWLDSNNG
jgi:hypothetical protein